MKPDLCTPQVDDDRYEPQGFDGRRFAGVVGPDEEVAAPELERVAVELAEVLNGEMREHANSMLPRVRGASYLHAAPEPEGVLNLLAAEAVDRLILPRPFPRE